ncbi:MAG: hypothetical protein H0W33_05110 [Gammaproteobacteria bacterium]|nr:hypothetical protein [Gammaproteobacteria bacterium]
MFALATAIDASLVAWLVRAYNEASPLIAAAGLIAAFALAGIVVFVNFQAYRCIAELENR